MRVRHVAAFALLALACSDDRKQTTTPDMASSVMPDMANGTAMTVRYVVDQVILPTNNTQYVYDPTGSGMFVNQFGKIVQQLSGQPFNVPLQRNEDTTINRGDGLALISFTVADPQWNDDPYTAARMYVAENQEPPDFSGAGSFTVDTSVPKATLAGPLAGGTFKSADPKTLTTPPTVYLQIVILPGIAVNLPVVGAQVSFSPSPTMLGNGILNGAIRESDVMSILLPAIQQALDQVAHQMPCQTDCMSVKSFFDTNHDGTISLDEVQNNSVLMNMLAPDVQLYDGDGNWHPMANPTTLDSISVGVAFHAVNAQFTE